ncbi:ParA family protein [Staphylococcus saprophyticus]|uniref:ParA family protein n=1 Tax=Staphylococcus saprophyticus TaxID=29385 RepID=UPI002DBA9770|nr:ParA family protein [Staphylococcus saprophyticus]MEB7678003.1 ParA family protein [Staphylococcus saprophyticus]
MAKRKDFWEIDSKQQEMLDNLKAKEDAITITINMFKGGVGKSTLTNIFGYISNRHDLKVLFIDSDPQRTLTKKLAKNFEIEKEAELSFMKAIENEDISKGISKLNKNIDLVKGDWALAWFDRYSRRALRLKDEYYLYKYLLEDVIKDYDLIFLDSVPTTTTLTHNCIVASDYMLIPVESEEDCYENAKDYMFYLSEMTQYNSKLDVLGMIVYLTEDNNKTNSIYLNKYKNEFKALVFENIINRLRRVMTWGSKGITENEPYDKKTLTQYNNVFWEFMNKLQERGSLND